MCTVDEYKNYIRFKSFPMDLQWLEECKTPADITDWKRRNVISTTGVMVQGELPDALIINPQDNPDEFKLSTKLAAEFQSLIVTEEKVFG